MIEQTERERQASDYESLAEMFDAIGRRDLGDEWRRLADELLAEDIAETMQ